MFSKVISEVVCYLCGDQSHRFVQCNKCKKLFCHDCKSTVCVSGGKTCFWCVPKRK